MSVVRFKVLGELPRDADAVAVGIFERSAGDSAGLKAIDKAVGGALGRALALKDFKGKMGSAMVLPVEGGLKRLMLVGLGRRAGFDVDQLRWAAASVVKAARGAKLKRVVVSLSSELPEELSDERVGQAMAEGAVMGGFSYTEFKKVDEEKAGALELQVAAVGKTGKGIGQGLRVGSVIGESANYAREIASKPGNVINPRTLVAQAKRLAAGEKLKVTVIDANKARQMGMGGLTAVGQGSENPPALIVLEYTGPGAAKKKPVAVVGKAITFDSGGISIKPAADMDAMKYDKCGGTAVLGILRAAARLKLPERLVGVIPTAENLPSQRSYRPGDILRFFNGTTSEIINTDAEGRLILADALAYVAKTYEPEAIVDMATLTGGVVIALGSVYAGLFANDDALAASLEQAGRATGELLWRLPLHERYEKLMEGYHADLVNAGPREASPVQGAIFLQHFVPKGTKWAHLDVAGTAHPKKDDRYLARGATGFGVRLVLEWLRRRS